MKSLIVIIDTRQVLLDGFFSFSGIDRTRSLVVVVDTRQILLGGFSSSLQLNQADTKGGWV